MPLFMQVTGTVSGPINGGIGVLKDHKGWIPLDDFAFGSNAEQKKATGDDATIRKAIQEYMEQHQGEAVVARKLGVKRDENFFGASVTLNRNLDVVSPRLMKWLSTGEEAKVVVHHCTMDGVVLFSLTLENARLKSYGIGAQKDGEITETLSVDWHAFEIETIEIGADGKPLP